MRKKGERQKRYVGRKKDVFCFNCAFVCLGNLANGRGTPAAGIQAIQVKFISFCMGQKKEPDMVTMFDAWQRWEERLQTIVRRIRSVVAQVRGRPTQLQGQLAAQMNVVVDWKLPEG